MLYSFQLTKILRELNPGLSIFATGFKDKENSPATVYWRGEEVCAVSKNVMPEETIMDSSGHVVKRGWRKLFRILADRKLIDYNEAVQMAKWER